MRIVYVAPFYTPVIGGVEEVVKKIAEYAASRGHETYVVTYNRLRSGGFNTLPKEEDINGIHVIRVKPSFTRSHGTYSAELPQVVKSLRPDIVHAHVWRHPHVFQIAKLKSILGFKAILHGHAPFHTFSQLGFITWSYHKLVDTTAKSFLNSYDAYIALTLYEKDVATHRLGLPKEKVVIIPNGIDSPKSQYNVDENDRYNKVLYLGRISREKNIPLLIKSMKYVIEVIRDAKLTLVGPDEGLMKWIYNHARTKNLMRAIKYLGPVYGDEKYKIYASSAVFASPSLCEAFGITVLEAGIVGTPSVITGQGGQIYTVPPGIASILAKPNPKDYAEAIMTILSDKKLWRRLGEGAKKNAEKYMWNRILPTYEKLYEV
jgi:glycosyltransferase involved in cell wall biosynthesis